MHGSENRNCETIVGQSDIHKYIKELNFKDCHAKILLIDSQSTMSDGVVIQVTGELSNDGRPMRRFMQTFVLAPQSEKKYYVHNDIFRYQDQVSYFILFLVHLSDTCLYRIRAIILYLLLVGIMYDVCNVR